MNPEKTNNSKFSANSLLLPSSKLQQAGTHSTTILFYVSILAFIIAFRFTDTPLLFGWYQQFMPNIGGRSVTDVFFLDSLTGWAVTNATNQNPDTIYILKTISGGDNWIIQYSKIQTGGGFPGYNGVYFLSQSIGFVCRVAGFDKSTDGGSSWTSLNVPEPFSNYNDMSILDENTAWLVSSNPADGGVFYTSTGGASWQQQINLGGGNPDKVYMFNERIGFISRTSSTQLRKTTNGGQNWNVVTGIGSGSFNDMYFVDSLTGWKCKTVGGGGWLMGKTTDGGFNWAEQILPFGGNISSGSGITRFDNINKDTIWGVGGNLFYPGQGSRVFLYRTTNTGDTWYLQIPDTSFQIPNLSFIDFVDKFKGWAYRVAPSGIHTTAGGDTTFYLPVKQISSNIPKEFRLFQNYPNPFNPVTKIKYQIVSNVKRETSNVKLTIYGITGKFITNLVDQKQQAGTYEIDFDGKNLSSGVYFYGLIVDGVLIDTKKMILIK